MPKAVDPHALLAKALQSLTLEEQGVVLKGLLAPTLALGSLRGTRVYRVGLGERPPATLVGEMDPFDKLGDRVGLLIRLPAPTHRALKQWSDDNGHSMNVIVRGLVEQFLEAGV